MQNGETNLIHRSTGPIEQMLDQCRREAAMKGRMRTKRATLELGLDVHGTSKQAKQTKQSTWPSTTSRVWTSWKSIDGVQRSWFRVRFTLKQNSDCLLLFFKVMHWPDDKQPKLSRQSRRRWWWTSSNVWPSRYVDHIHYAPTWATVNNDVCLVSRQGTSSNKQKWSNGDQKESCQRCRRRRLRFNSMWTPWQIHSLNVNNIFYTRKMGKRHWLKALRSFVPWFVRVVVVKRRKCWMESLGGDCGVGEIQKRTTKNQRSSQIAVRYGLWVQCVRRFLAERQHETDPDWWIYYPFIHILTMLVCSCWRAMHAQPNKHSPRTENVNRKRAPSKQFKPAWPSDRQSSAVALKEDAFGSFSHRG